MHRLIRVFTDRTSLNVGFVMCWLIYSHFSINMCWVFIDAPPRDTSNGYPHYMFLWRNIWSYEMCYFEMLCWLMIQWKAQFSGQGANNPFLEKPALKNATSANPETSSTSLQSDLDRVHTWRLDRDQFDSDQVDLDQIAFTLATKLIHIKLCSHYGLNWSRLIWSASSWSGSNLCSHCYCIHIAAI